MDIQRPKHVFDKFLSIDRPSVGHLEDFRIFCPEIKCLRSCLQYFMFILPVKDPGPVCWEFQIKSQLCYRRWFESPEMNDDSGSQKGVFWKSGLFRKVRF